MHRQTRRVPTFIALFASAALALAACGGDTEPSPAETAPPQQSEPDSEETTEGRPGTTEGTAPDEGAEAPEDSAGTDPIPDEELPGEEHGLYFNTAGAVADVVGVPDGDVLFVRASPDHTAQEVSRLAPTGEVVLAGRERSVESGLWAEVELADGVGWVNSGYLGYLPESREDITDMFLEYEPQADEMELVADIAESRVNLRTEEGLDGPEWTLIQTPEDSPVYRVDIFPFYDDATYGERVEIHFEDTDDGVAISQVQTVQICSRGISDNDLCV